MFWATLLLVANAANANEQPELERSFISLEARVDAMDTAFRARPWQIHRHYLQKAQKALGDDQALAVALLQLALRPGLPRHEYTHLLIELARAEAAIGHRSAAMRHFAEALQMAKQRHQIAAAFEGFVHVTAGVRRIGDLPSVSRYVEAMETSQGLDDAGFETLYKLGLHLLRKRDARGEAIMQQVKQEGPVGRRALYVLAVWELAKGDHAAPYRALPLFQQAAELPQPSDLSAEAVARDNHVQELSWIAIGRLSFEQDALTEGAYAYHQVPTDSPRFLEAFFELGWLLLEGSAQKTARLAFGPVAALADNTPLGRKAELLQGFVLLGDGDFAGSLAYYEQLAKRYAQRTKRFEQAVAAIGDLGELARDCETRRQAMRSPILTPLLQRPEIHAAGQMTVQLDELNTLAYAIERQIQQLDDLLSGEGADNPLRMLERDRERAIQLLLETRSMARTWNQTVLRRRWVAGPAQPEQPCCEEPKLRAGRLRQRLEKMIAIIDAHHGAMQQKVTFLRDDMRALGSKQRALLKELQPEILRLQREAVHEAVRQEHQALKRMVLEGHAGVLEVIWQYKEQHREQIRAAEMKRKGLLDALDAQYRGTAEASEDLSRFPGRASVFAD